MSLPDLLIPKYLATCMKTKHYLKPSFLPVAGSNAVIVKPGSFTYNWSIGANTGWYSVSDFKDVDPKDEFFTAGHNGIGISTNPVISNNGTYRYHIIFVIYTCPIEEEFNANITGHGILLGVDSGAVGSAHVTNSQFDSNAIIKRSEKWKYFFNVRLDPFIPSTVPSLKEINFVPHIYALNPHWLPMENYQYD